MPRIGLEKQYDPVRDLVRRLLEITDERIKVRYRDIDIGNMDGAMIIGCVITTVISLFFAIITVMFIRYRLWSAIPPVAFMAFMCFCIASACVGWFETLKYKFNIWIARSSPDEPKRATYALVVAMECLPDLDFADGQARQIRHTAKYIYDKLQQADTSIECAELGREIADDMENAKFAMWLNEGGHGA